MNEPKDQQRPDLDSGQFSVQPTLGRTSIIKGVVLGLVLVLLVLAGGVWVYKMGVNKNRDVSLLKSENPYPAGTSVEMPLLLPSEFPQDAVREQYKFDKVSTVKYPDGKTIITVAYTSENPMLGLLAIYTEYFKKTPWQLQSSELLQNSGVVVAKNEVGQMTLTIAPGKDDKGSKVTFSYQYIIK